MQISKQAYVMFLINFAYISSIVYVPITIANNAVTNKFLPVLSLLCLLFFLRNDIKLRHVKKFSVIAFIAFSFVLSAGSFLSLAYTFVFLSLLIFIIPYFVLFELYGGRFIRKHLSFILTVSVVSIAFAWFEYLYPSNASNIFFLRGSIYSEKGQMSSLFSNPNVFGLMSAFSFQIYLIMNKKSILTFLSFFLIFSSGVWLSESRMAWGIITLILILKFIPIIKISQSFFIYLFIFLTLLFTLNFELTMDYMNLNLRNDIWTGVLSVFSSNVFFGVGLGEFQQISELYTGREEQSPNNLFVGLLAEVGLVGFILFFYFIFRMLYSNPGKVINRNYSYHSSVMIMIMIISQFSEYMLIYVAPYVLILVLFLALIQWNKE